MKTLSQYIEGPVISIKKAITEDEFQNFVNDFYSLFEKYKLKENKQLTQMFLNELWSKNIKEYK